MKKTFPIYGMHCKSCEKRICDEISSIEGVSSVDVKLKRQSAAVSYDSNVSDKDIEDAIIKAGYEPKAGKPPLFSRDPKDYLIFFISAIAIGVLTYLFSDLNLNFDNFSGSQNYLISALLMGLAAGFSACMALVGGLVIGISAKYRQQNPDNTRWQNFKPNLFFNLGRIAGFALLGGILGLIGSAFTFKPTLMGSLTITAGVFMLIIGLQLTNILPRLSGWSLPTKLSEKLGIDKSRKQGYSNFGAIILGILSFVLPCGFTQVAQLIAVSSGSFVSGGLIMGIFAIGTTLGLLVVGAAANLASGQKVKTALRVIGVVVISLALINISSGLNLTGVKLPKFDFSNQNTSSNNSINDIDLIFQSPNKQFNKKQISLKQGEKYRIHILPVANGAGCMSTVMLPGLTEDSPRLLKNNQRITFEFEAEEVGEYEFMCAMGIAFDTVIKVEV